VQAHPIEESPGRSVAWNS